MSVRYLYLLDSLLTHFRPPVGVQKMVSALSEKPHKAMHYCQTVGFFVHLVDWDARLILLKDEVMV